MRLISIGILAMVLVGSAIPCMACGSGPHPEVWDTLPPTCPRNDTGEAIALSLTPVLLAGLAWTVGMSRRR